MFQWLQRAYPTKRTAGGFGAPPTRPEPGSGSGGGSGWSAFSGRGRRLGD